MANLNNYSHDNLDDFNETFPTADSNTNYLRIIQWNIRGMNNLSKFDSILEMVDQCQSSADIIVIGETWVKNGNSKLYNIPGFNSVFSCRDSSNGGLAMFIKTDIKYSVPCNVHIDGFHHLHVELEINSRIYDVHGFYRPPSYDVNCFMDKLENCLDNSNCLRSCFLVGDVNIPVNSQNNNVVVKYKSLLESYGFVCTNTIPTRPVSANILDHVVCRVDDVQFTRNDTILNDESDHCIIVTSFKLFEPRAKITLSKTIVDHRKLATDFEQFLANLGEVVNVNAYLENIASAYNQLSVKHSKTISKNISTKQNCCPWMSFSLWSLMKLKNNYIKRVKRNPNNQHLKDLLKHISNKVITLKRKSKKTYYDNLLSNTPHSKLWKKINHIFGKTSSNDNIVLFENGVKIEDNHQICEKFNSYFTSVGQQLASSINITTDNPLSNLRHVSSSIFLNPASANEVTLIIHDLERNKSPGHDGITVDVIKNNCLVFSRILAQSFNKIIETGTYPSCLKVARVVPIFKSGDACNVNNYRPISTLSIFNKILEKLLLNRITTFLNQHNVLYDYQYGFRQGSSTATATVELLDDIIKAIDSKELVGALFLDLRKAFDTLDHSVLLRKLNGYGIRGIANQIIGSYLQDRMQFVAIGDVKSSLQPIRVGVPQGSNIGPLLFLLYVNDLSRLQLKGIPRLFADDTALFYPHVDANTIVNFMTQDLVTLSKYFSSNLLSLNVSKTKYMIFHSVRKKVDQHRQVLLNSSPIEEVKSFKYLGLILDSTLSWVDHIKHIERKVTSLCGILRRVSYFVSRNILLKFYFAHIHSSFSYLTLTWGRASKSSLRSLQILQNRCLKTIFNKPFLYPSLQLYSDNFHNILPIQSLCNLQTVIFVHDTLHNNCFHHTINMPSAPHNYPTRQATNLRQIRALTTFGQKRVSIIGPKLYNQLPERLKALNNRHAFKFHVKQHLKLNLHDILG